MSGTPSTKNLRAMPDPETLWKRCVSLALAELAIGSEYRHYRLDPSWEKGAIFTRENGAGDNYTIAFVKAGVLIRGFDHTSRMSPYQSADEKTLWPGMFDAVPRSMRELLDDPRVVPEPREVTFCIAHGYGLAKWVVGVTKFPEDYDEMPGDGSRWMLASLGGGPRQFADWASDYYGQMVPQEPIATLFAHGVLQDAALAKINPKVDVAAVRRLADATRYGKSGRPPFD